MARPPMGAKLLGKVQGSEAAKRKVSLMLETMAGKKSVAKACEELGIGEARFHEMRSELLAGLVGLAEPKVMGRPRQEMAPDPEYVAHLENEKQELARQLKIEMTKLELAAVVPQVLMQSKKNG
jgi:hypothetical protein